jgi:hypothetical protein
MRANRVGGRMGLESPPLTADFRHCGIRSSLRSREAIPENTVVRNLASLAPLVESLERTRFDQLASPLGLGVSW